MNYDLPTSPTPIQGPSTPDPQIGRAPTPRGITLDQGAILHYSGIRNVDRYDHFEIAFNRAVLEDPEFALCRERLTTDKYRRIKLHCQTSNFEFANWPKEIRTKKEQNLRSDSRKFELHSDGALYHKAQPPGGLPKARRVICDDDLFHTIKHAHEYSQHAGRDKVFEILHTEVHAVSRDEIEWYTTNCPGCDHKARGIYTMLYTHDCHNRNSQDALLDPSQQRQIQRGSPFDACRTRQLCHPSTQRRWQSLERQTFGHGPI